MFNNEFYTNELIRVAQYSDDESKQVAAIIVNNNDQIISEGSNTLPTGLCKTDERCSKPLKYLWLNHAERNAIYKAAREGISTNGCKIYVNYFPCVDCSRAIIQAGIVELFAPKPDFEHQQWGESWRTALEMLTECGVKVNYYDL